MGAQTWTWCSFQKKKLKTMGFIAATAAASGSSGPTQSRDSTQASSSFPSCFNAVTCTAV
ncbi:MULTISPECIES: hypothetical protein [Myxococcus]|uniref:hypothetical protein n=1 Tax=Myxococcus TaxID=32 RepID=UPI001E3DFF11|nr:MULTISPECIES: hypothetical protein [Myxococcus]MCK8497493.1 hypothetical protein [Myxococcus fulvus]